MKGKSKVRALGDDPLAWIAQETESRGDAKLKAKKTPPKKSDAKKIDVEKKLGGKYTLEPVVSGTKKIGQLASSETAVKQNLESANLYKLEPVVTVAQVGRLKEKLSNLLSSDTAETRIDASVVENIDGAALQLLLSFSKKLSAQQSRVVWLSISPQMLERIRMLGLADEFGVGETVN